MNYVFFGTPRFAATILEKLIEAGMPPIALFCNPDKPAGRHQVITPPPTKQVVNESRLTIGVFQPANKEKLLTTGREILRGTDFAIVAAYSYIIPLELMRLTKLGMIGVHPSLLPKLRGPSPIQSAILTGEEDSGVTLFLLDEKIDHGPIITSSKLIINDSFSNSQELENRLAVMAGELLVAVLPRFSKGEIKPQPQAESRATSTSKFTSKDGYITREELEDATSGRDIEKVYEIYRKIRAFNPEPGVYSILSGERTKILSAVIEGKKLVLKRIQRTGKKPASL